uniref:Uncharacterized protein n=1 Tax=Peronospora matthiolae TaxID=2874970 RepID=A0AAV1TM83_9STRA
MQELDVLFTMGCAQSTSAQDPSTEVNTMKVQTDETVATEETKAVVVQDETKPIEAAEEPKTEDVVKDESTVEKLTVEELGTSDGQGRKTEAVVKDEELTMEDFKVEEVVVEKDEIIDGPVKGARS